MGIKIRCLDGQKRSRELFVQDGLFVVSCPVEKEYDFSEYQAVPGFVDLHIHGSAGYDVATCDAAGLIAMSEALAQHGVTAFLPTLPSCFPEDSVAALKVIHQAMELQKKGEACRGAVILGAHMEGPFMKDTYKGALNSNAFLPANRENWEKLTGEYEGIVRRITVDPLAEGVLEWIPYLVSKGIVVSLGHTAADADTVLAGFRAGAKSVTHLYNAMPSLHHRTPGPVGAAMADDDSYAELILDFLHVSPVAAKAAIKAKGVNRIAIITDACQAAGMPDGDYVLAGSLVYVRNGEARIPAGNLASSTVFMDKELRHILQLGFSLEQASQMLSSNPAAMVPGCARGGLEVGCAADLVLLNEDCTIHAVFVRGCQIK